MSIRVDMTSNDVDRQIELLRYYPEIVVKHFRPALQATTKDLYGEIKPNIPRDTGKALAAFKARVSGKGVDLQGQVGWWGKTAAWYINIVEHGARPHSLVKGSTIRSRRGARAFADANRTPTGVPVFIEKAGGFRTMGDHPGAKELGFMKQGFAALQSISDLRMMAASEAVLAELRVP